MMNKLAYDKMVEALKKGKQVKLLFVFSPSIAVDSDFAFRNSQFLFKKLHALIISSLCQINASHR